MINNNQNSNSSQNNIPINNNDSLEDIKEKIKKLEEQDKITKNENSNSEQDRQDDLNKEKSEQNKEIALLNDKFMRLMAEFENYKKRSIEEKIRASNMGAIGILKIIIRFFDDFNRASEQCPNEIEGSDFWKGIKLIESNLMNELSKKGLKEMDIVNKPFDPNKMESLMQDPNVDSGIVSKVIEKGYEYDSELARIAKVIVGSKI